MRLGTQTASLTNHVLANSQNPEPKVGDGCTILMWTDRHAGTIVKLTATQIHVQEDHAKRIDTNGMSESQEYEYTRNPEAPVQIFRRLKNGRYRSSCGTYLAVGYRRAYHDFSF